MTFRVGAGAGELGTSESTWLSSGRLVACQELALDEPGRVVVLAPHPDDEVLACGGTMLRLERSGHSLAVVAVTDGEGSHPRSRVISKDQMARRRTAERAEALARLGLRDVSITRLGYPDSSVSASAELVERFLGLVRGASLCLAPWEYDGHPDHDATGRAAERACTVAKVRLARYPVWAWHWATPSSDVIPWSRARRVVLDAEVLARKRSALLAYASQTQALGVGPDEAAILPPAVLDRFDRNFETFFV